MAVALRDIREWAEYGQIIMASKAKLDSVINQQYYSKDFEYVYYAIIKSSVDFKAIERSLDVLNKRAMGLSSSDPLKETLREFIASSKLLYTSANIDEFRRFLKSNGILPVDPIEEARKAREAEEHLRREREEARRAQKAKEEAQRRAQEAEEHLRREREEARRAQKAKEEAQRRAREAVERYKREREERERVKQEAFERERRKQKAIMRIIRIAFTSAAVALIFVGLIFGVPSYRYHYTEYRALMSDANNYINQKKYDDAINALSKARDRKTSTKERHAIDMRIANVQKMKRDRIQQLQQEIETILNTFKMTSFKYGRPENDFKTTQEKIDLLKSLSPDNVACAKYQTELDYIQKRKI